MIYKDNTASFNELLEKDESFTIHHRNLQSLATQMLKVKRGTAPRFMNHIFSSNLNLGVSAGTRLQTRFYNPTNPKKVYTGLETRWDLKYGI